MDFTAPPPYRVLTSEEKEAIQDYIGNFTFESKEAFWRQTETEARRVINQIGAGGFIIGGSIEWGEMSIDGVTAHIYPQNYHEGHINILKSADWGHIIGSVSLWEFGGFLLNPVDVRYENRGLVDDSIKLRDYLTEQGIPFRDDVNRHSLNEEIESLEQRVQQTRNFLERLNGIELREG